MIRSRRAAVAIAVAAAALAPGCGYGQSAIVSLYGRLNVDVEVVNGRLGNGSNPNVVRVNSNSSALGIRGSEYLGNGLVAIFQIESQVQATTGGAAIASRESFIGIDAPWGVIKLGYFLAPYDDIHPIFGNVPTLVTSILSTSAVWAQGYAAKTIGGFDARLPNSIRYDSPDWSGLTASVQYSLGQGTSYPGGLFAYVVSSGIFYTRGPLQLGIGYEQNVHVRQNPVPGGEPLNDSAFSIAGAWDFGPVRVGAVYEYLDYDTPQSSGDVASLTRNFWGLSGTFPLGPGLLYGFYGHAGDGKGGAAQDTRVAGLAKGPQTSATQWEISYTYAFSKRTLLYGGYVRIDNASNASYTFNNNPYPTAIGGKPSGFVVGMAHFF